MRLLLLGKNGQLGRELQRTLAPLGELVALDRHSGEFCGDLGNPAGLADTIRCLRPDVIVNAAAYTAVDRAEAEPDVAHQVNALAPAVLAREAALLGAWVVHYSTDYVFDGHGQRPWQEDDATSPLNTYGRTKFAGEQAVRQACERHLILRTSWLYGEGDNFMAAILRLVCSRDSIKVVADQFGAPTGADLVADLSARLVLAATGRPDLAGVYHAAAAGQASRHAWAKHILEHARSMPWPGVEVMAKEVVPVSSAAMPAAAARPLNCRLDCSKISAALGLDLPPWESGVNRALEKVAAGLQMTR